MADAATGKLGTVGEVENLPDADEIYARAPAENFSVASLVLGRDDARHLTAIYGYARLVDQIGDAVAGRPLARLDAFEADLARVFDRRPPEHPLLRALAPTVRELDLPRGPFDRLIEANRRDQEVAAYATFDELVGYCDLSANPVGELVLHVFGAATPDRIALSDRVCTALQLAEHWQDVAEDFAPRAASTCRPRTSSASASRPPTSTRPRPAHTLRRAARLRGRPRTTPPRRGRAARRAAPRPRPDRRRRLRRRRPRGPRRDRRRRTTTSSPARRGRPRAARPRDTRTWARETMTAAARLRALPPRRAGVRLELLRRDAAAPARPARRALRRLRAGAPDRRRRRRRPLRRTDKLAELARDPRGLERLDDAARSRPRRRRATPRARFPIPLERLRRPRRRRRDGRAGDRVRDVRRSRALLPAASPARSAASRSASSNARTGSAAARSRTTSASRSRSANILRDVSEDAAHRARLPARARTSSGSAATFATGASTGPLELLIAFEARARARPARARARPRAAARPPKRAPACSRWPGKYRRLLERIAAEPALVLSGRSRCGVGEGLVLARSLAGARA